ncbi:lytic transglycosylase domain-containing protein [Rivibacter subsaxonicus]|uniref:Soluble lytic murein transglycosylase n=1 Tax=Rivibacter subsaxonicus TaxID=457575 RepID=A0A4V2FUI2_9BURK|nr:lytic transglycosylase domain-containing protein [Rivibacter subsaxonicus]RZU02176.1 soluble lytic murein transglycosylase [Rivibacter subsaxonicus]
MKSLLRRLLASSSLAAIALSACLALPTAAAPINVSDASRATLLDAREALRKKDRARLAGAVAQLGPQDPLAMWAAYWELGNRLPEAGQAELEVFYARWPGTYVEDRLRNDWLLELGKRRDWANFRVEFPRFRMNDDREVTCYALLTRHLDGEDVRAPARESWFAQREADDGCTLLAQTLYEAGQFKPADAWRKARLSIEANRKTAARNAVALVDADAAAAVGDLYDQPQRYLALGGGNGKKGGKGAGTARRASAEDATAQQLAALALVRLAASDPAAAADAMDSRWAAKLAPTTAAWVWAGIGRQAAQKLDGGASTYYQHAQTAARSTDPELSDETLAWGVRAALRANDGAGRWQQVVQGVGAMSAAEQRDPTWIYWKARALQALSADSQDSAALVAQSRELLKSIASPLHFYGKLALEDLGQPLTLPARPPVPSTEEKRATSDNAGLQRALALIAIGLRNEGVREWNYSLRGMNDRELLAAAQLACERGVWDRCINTSERTREQVDMAQRFPTPYREDVVANARESGLDPAFVYGLIRQESRFITDARSGVGASGLMQIMPATAKWTARKLGLSYTQAQIDNPEMNLRLGTGYLRLLLDSFEDSKPLATAAYNAGPGRPRKWREGPVLDAAAWAENIPFNETRDYVKKVLSNSTDYAALMSGKPQSLRARLGDSVGPRVAPLAPAEKELP